MLFIQTGTKWAKKSNRVFLLCTINLLHRFFYFSLCFYLFSFAIFYQVEVSVGGHGNISNLFPVQVAVWHETVGPGNFERDICVNSPTGSGKTLAYALPLVQNLGCGSHSRPCFTGQTSL